MPNAPPCPCLYLEEVRSAARVITSVDTAIAAFVGFTRIGAPDKAVTITSFTDFDHSYGGLDINSPVSFAVRQFFINGGRQAVVVRVARGCVSAEWVLNSVVPDAAIAVTAASPGAWANDLRITVDYSDLNNAESEFNLVVSRLQTDGITLIPVEAYRHLNINSASSQFVDSVVNNASSLIRVKRRDDLKFDQSGFAVSMEIAFPLTAIDLAISGLVDGTTSFGLLLVGPTPVGIDDLVDAVNAAIEADGLSALLEASNSGAWGSVGTGFLRLSSKTNDEGSSVMISEGTFGGLVNRIRLGIANGGHEFTGNAQQRPTEVSNLVPCTRGADGTRAGPREIVGSPENMTGMHTLLDVDLFNILSVPETFDMTESEAAAVIPAAVALCEKRCAFYIVDAPSSRSLADIATWANDATQSSNAAVYFPPIKLADPLDQSRPRAVAPSGTLAGVYARIDSNNGVWKAPAGAYATLNGVRDATVSINDAENGLINPKGVNALRRFPNIGLVAWGARTLRGSDELGDEFKYVSVRRLALFLEQSILRGTQWVVFEPNDESLWPQLRANVDAFMHALYRQGAFQGHTPRDAYFVKCDHETNTQTDISSGLLNILVGFAALKPAEFVMLKLQHRLRNSHLPVGA